MYIKFYHPTPKIFYGEIYMPVTMILFFVSVILAGYFAFIYATSGKENLRLNRMFLRNNCKITKRCWSLVIDEKNKKWSCKNACSLYDFSDILDYDIQIDGISMKAKRKFIRSVGNVSAEMVAKRNKTVEQIVVVITLNNDDIVNIPVNNMIMKVGSMDYEKKIKMAEDICNELDKIKNNR